MKGKRVTPFVSVLLASTLPLVGAVLAQDLGRPPSPPPPGQSRPQDPSANQNQSEVKTFSGKITKTNGKYVLEDPSTNSSYYLDEAKSPKKYEGKTVVVTGTLDAANRMIHVQQI